MALPITGDASFVSEESQPLAVPWITILETVLLDIDSYPNDKAKSGKVSGAVCNSEKYVNQTSGVVVVGAEYEVIIAGGGSEDHSVNGGPVAGAVGDRWIATAVTAGTYDSDTIARRSVRAVIAQGDEPGAPWYPITTPIVAGAIPVIQPV